MSIRNTQDALEKNKRDFLINCNKIKPLKHHLTSDVNKPVSCCCLCTFKFKFNLYTEGISFAEIMKTDQIQYSEKYNDDKYEYR